MNDEIKEILDLLQEDIESNILIEVRSGVFKPLLDYITNLQKENDDLKGRLENAVADCNLRLQEFKDYKSRIEKANNFIEENWISYKDSKDFKEFDEVLEVFIKEINDLYNILNGDNNE